jgi:hypothetical protein
MKIQQLLTSDDLDGTEFEPGENGITNFVIAMPQLTGKTLYRKVDLRDKNVQAYVKAVSKFWDAGQPVKLDEVLAHSASRARRPGPKATGGAPSDDIRTWARENGYQVAERGRVPQSVREAYDKAHA